MEFFAVVPVLELFLEARSRPRPGGLIRHFLRVFDLQDKLLKGSDFVKRFRSTRVRVFAVRSGKMSRDKGSAHG